MNPPGAEPSWHRGNRRQVRQVHGQCGAQVAPADGGHYGLQGGLNTITPLSSRISSFLQSVYVTFSVQNNPLGQLKLSREDSIII